MAFTTVQRVKDLIRDQGSAFHAAPTEAALTNVVAGANALLEQLGVPATTTDAGLLMAADRLAISFLMDGEIVRMFLRGDAQSVGSFRIASQQLEVSALNDAQKYIPLDFRRPAVRANRNWSFNRGGPLDGGSEAGTYRRTGSKR